MLATSFYKMSKSGGKISRHGTVDAPKLSAGPSRGRGRGASKNRSTSTTSTSATRSTERDGGRAGTASRYGQPPVRHIDFDDDDDDEDSDKENRRHDYEGDLSESQDVQAQGQVQAAGDEDDDDDDEEWKCKLLEIIQQYPEVYDLAHPRYKDKALREVAWEEIAVGMNASGKHTSLI